MDDVQRVPPGFAGTALEIPDHRIDEVERGDVERLAPPPQPAPNGGAGGAANGSVHYDTLAGLPRRAKAGAPIKLTTRLMPYTTKPRVRAFSSGTPSGTRKRANAPSRTPNPPTVIGSTCTMATAGTNARRAVGPRSSPSPSAARYAASTTANW